MELKQLAKKNPWWTNKHLIEEDMHILAYNRSKIKRKYALIKALDEGIYSIRGARQIGKTTWLKLKIKELLKAVEPEQIFYYSLDLISDKKELAELIEVYLESTGQKRRHIFLDEVPSVKDWQLAIKDLYDSGKLKNCTVILTGSHSLDISKSIERLPGRIGAGKRDYIFFPINFLEYINLRSSLKLGKGLKKDIFTLENNAKKIFNLFMDYIKTGGFPKAIDDYLNYKKIDDFTYETYIKWIIGDLAKWNKKEQYAKQILTRIIQTYSSEVNWSTIKAKTDMDSHSTAANYILALEEMFLLHFIYLYEPNKKRAVFHKNKKIYAADPFLYAVIKKWVYSEDINFDNNNEISKIVEGIVLNNIIMQLFENHKSNIFDYKDKIFYYRNKTRTMEIDFLIKKINLPIEVKWQEKAHNPYRNVLILSKESCDLRKRIMPVAYFLILYLMYKNELFSQLNLIKL